MTTLHEPVADEARRDAQRQTAAERMRRSRERKRLGLRTVLVDVRAEDIEWLVQRGHLNAGETADPFEVGNSIGRLLDELVPPRQHNG